MLNKTELDKFWVDRTQKYMDPCHYMNEWMDKYAFETRTTAIRRVWPLLRQATRVLDVGCGDGTYTEFLSHHMPTIRHTVGVDRPEMIALAKKKYGDHPWLEFHPGVVGHDLPSWENIIPLVEIITLFTVYDFLTIENRKWLRDVIAKNAKPGTRVIILDLFPTIVPSYQKGLGYKEVETKGKKYSDWYQAGFDVEQIVPVNYMDTKLFYKLGKNRVTYWLTRMADKVLAFFREPKYSLVVFRKL